MAKLSLNFIQSNSFPNLKYWMNRYLSHELFVIVHDSYYMRHKYYLLLLGLLLISQKSSLMVR